MMAQGGQVSRTMSKQCQSKTRTFYTEETQVEAIRPDKETQVLKSRGNKKGRKTKSSKEKTRRDETFRIKQETLKLPNKTRHCTLNNEFHIQKKLIILDYITLH